MRYESRFADTAHRMAVVTLGAWLAVVLALATGAAAAGTVGTSLPADFPVIMAGLAPVW